MAHEQATQIPAAVKRTLGGHGKKLHSHEVHLRRTSDGKGYIARHDLTDSQGNPPTDGQRGSAEYALPDKAAMMAHMEEHMGQAPEPDEDEGQPQQGGQAGAGTPN